RCCSVAEVEHGVVVADLFEQLARRIAVAPDIDHATDLDRSQLRMVELFPLAKTLFADVFEHPAENLLLGIGITRSEVQIALLLDACLAFKIPQLCREADDTHLFI